MSQAPNEMSEAVMDAQTRSLGGSYGSVPHVCPGAPPAQEEQEQHPMEVDEQNAVNHSFVCFSRSICSLNLDSIE